MPKPFDWITIPAGKVTLLEDLWDSDKTYLEKNKPTTFDVAQFQIAKYPLTNAQYRKFIEAGGYNTQKRWTDAGWQQKQSEGWTEPRYWDDDDLNADTQPVVGISWYEAIAFCHWLSDATGEKIMLPTEQEWQRAAQGDDGRTYPWGNDWNRDLCNNNADQKGIGKTTPVTQYEGKGDSLFGVVDMAGNVWEWCRTNFKDGNQNINGTGVRVLRGGDWNHNNTDNFRCTERGRLPPNYWYGLRGFRLARFNY